MSYRGVRGVNFLSVHADNRLAIAAGKLFTPMPYRRAKMAYRPGEFTSHVIRTQFEIRGEACEADRGSLEAFLLERYRLYAADRSGELLRADVQHPRWRTQSVDAKLKCNRLGDEFDLGFSAAPELAHFSPGVPAKFGSFVQAKV